MNKRSQRDLYIDALTYGKNKLLDAEMFSREEIKEHLQKKGYLLSKPINKAGVVLPKGTVFERLFGDVFSFGFQSDSNEDRWFLNLDGYFRLLDYEELEDARQSSRRATWLAVIAIVLNIVVLGVSIYFSHRSLTEPITISPHQFEQMMHFYDQTLQGRHQCRTLQVSSSGYGK